MIVQIAAAPIAPSFSADGVEEKRESISACSFAPPSFAASRSVKTPTTCGRISRVMVLRKGVPSWRFAPTNSTEVAAAVVVIVTLSHPAISATGADSSGTSRCNTDSVPSVTETISPLAPALPEACGMVDNTVPDPAAVTTEHGSIACNRSGTYETSGASTPALPACGQSSVA